MVRQLRKNEKSAENKLIDMEICNINNREFKITVLKKLKDMQENTVKQFNELRKQINKQMSTLPKRSKV